MTRHQEEGWRLVTCAFALTCLNGWFALGGDRLSPLFAVMALVTLAGGGFVLWCLLTGSA